MFHIIYCLQSIGLNVFIVVYHIHIQYSRVFFFCFLPETVSHQPCLLGCRNLLKYSQTSSSWNIWQTSHCFWCPKIPHSMLVSLAVCMHTPACWNSIPTVKDKVAFSVGMITLNTFIFDKQVSSCVQKQSLSESVVLYLVVWSYVGKVKVGVNSQGYSQSCSLPGNSCHLFARNF